MKKENYIEYCRGELRKVFLATKSSKPDDQHKYRTEGLLHAARLLELMSSQEIESMFEQEHLAVFGESVAQRQKRKSTYAELKERAPDAYLDIPAVERKR